METKAFLFRWGLGAGDRHKLRAALSRVRQNRHLRRLQAVLLVAEGQPVRAAARSTGLSVQSLYNALRRYQQRHRPGDLADRPRRGRPPVATVINGQRITAALRRQPTDCGYMANTWTVGLLRLYLQNRYGEPLGRRTLRRRLRRLGLRWKRPRYVFKMPDPQKEAKKRAFCGVSGEKLSLAMPSW